MRLPRPWDSPGKTTGVGCHFLLQCMKLKNESEVAQSDFTESEVRLLATPWTAADQAPPSMGFSRQEYWSGMLGGDIALSGALEKNPRSVTVPSFPHLLKTLLCAQAT